MENNGTLASERGEADLAAYADLKFEGLPGSVFGDGDGVPVVRSRCHFAELESGNENALIASGLLRQAWTGWGE